RGRGVGGGGGGGGEGDGQPLAQDRHDRDVHVRGDADRGGERGRVAGRREGDRRGREPEHGIEQRDRDLLGVRADPGPVGPAQSAGVGFPRPAQPARRGHTRTRRAYIHHSTRSTRSPPRTASFHSSRGSRRVGPAGAGRLPTPTPPPGARSLSAGSNRFTANNSFSSP